MKTVTLLLRLTSAGIAAASARDLSSRHKGSLRHVYSRVVRGFTVNMKETDARRLAADPNVAYVEQDQTIGIDDTQTNATWGLDRIDQSALPLSTTYTYATAASNVRAYIIDTGILTSHSDFGGRASSGYDFVDNDANATDCNGHGTHVAGTVGGARYGVAKGVRLVAGLAGQTVRIVVDASDAGTASLIEAAVDDVSIIRS
ncbi:S8 family serine peptidase [Planotetraspora thailandica]|nr:S8 family serine peptidase [Planotetraspora thailandica]